MELPNVGYSLLDHPADLGIEAFGRNLPEAFEQAALGLISIILDPDRITHSQLKEIVIEGTDFEQLLVKWLTEVLYLYDGESFAGGKFEIIELSPNKLRARVLGEAFDLERHSPRLDVKAITYHQLLLKQDDSGAQIRVFLDI
jgi:SHS2 domain-containing protein